jgi:AmmeMemoRadiSam system protein A
MNSVETGSFGPHRGKADAQSLLEECTEEGLNNQARHFHERVWCARDLPNLLSDLNLTRELCKFFSEGAEGCLMELSDEDKRELLRIARRSIECTVRGLPLPVPNPTSDALRETRGAFVTLTEHGHLRGCIGYTEAMKPLADVVNEVAAKAAVEDPRFPPVSEEELNEIELDVSVLSPLQKVSDISTIEVGRHGLLLELGYFRGLLLPQVAVEYKWDREAFLENTSRKAGLPPDAWKERDAILYSFTAEVFSEKELKPQDKGTQDLEGKEPL